jgi:hypothetical protein
LGIVEEVAKRLGIEPGRLERDAVRLWLLRRLRLVEAEIAGILARYGAGSAGELEEMIREGRVPEHPAWEDLIALERLEEERRRVLEALRHVEERVAAKP